MKEDKTQEPKGPTMANAEIENEEFSHKGAEFVDNRVEAAAQRRMQETILQSPKTRQAAQLHAQMNPEKPIQRKIESDVDDKTGLPHQLKIGIEELSGYSMDNVMVHRNSDKPAQLKAHAFTQGADIHLGPGQEKHLAHEAWHVVQQKQGRVKPTVQMKGDLEANDDVGLEKEADNMGARAAQKGFNNKADINETSQLQLIPSVNPIVQAKLWRGQSENEWVDDRNNSSWLEQIDTNIYRNHYNGEIYEYHEDTDQFTLRGNASMYYDIEYNQLLHQLREDLYILNGKFYSYDGKYYNQSERLSSFNLPNDELIRRDQIDMQYPVIIDCYQLDHPQVASTLTAPNREVLKTSGSVMDRAGVDHSQLGQYTIEFEVFYAPGQFTTVYYDYSIKEPDGLDLLSSAYEVPIYIGSHWTSDIYDDDFSKSLLRDGINEIAQLGEGLYLTDDDDLGLKAGWDAVKRTKGKAVVEWQVYKAKGVDLRDLSTELMNRDLNWRELPWRTDEEGGEVLREYDTITKPRAENETKLNPRAFRKVEIRPGRRLIITENMELFQRIEHELGEKIREQLLKQDQK